MGALQLSAQNQRMFHATNLRISSSVSLEFSVCHLLLSIPKCFLNQTVTVNTCMLSHSDIDDDSRVILKPLHGHDDCQHDYINASYVDVSISTSYQHRYNCGMLIIQNLDVRISGLYH